MMQDMQGIEQYEQDSQYQNVLKKIDEKVKNIKQDRIESEPSPEDGLDDEYLMQNIEGDLEQQESGYQAEYFEVINEISRLCQIITHNSKTENKEKKLKIE